MKYQNDFHDLFIGSKGRFSNIVFTIMRTDFHVLKFPRLLDVQQLNKEIEITTMLIINTSIEVYPQMIELIEMR